MIVWVLVAAAVVLLFWPTQSAKQLVNPYMPSLVEPPAPKPHIPTYLDAVSCLQTVRHRLVETEQLGEAQQEAIDSITLALVRGSER